MTKKAVEMKVQTKLKRWCELNSLEYLAYKAEVTAGYIHKLMRGERVPSVKLAKKIERITEGAVTLKSWERARKQQRLNN